MSNEETVASLPIKEQVDLLAQALLREHMHRCNFRQTLKKFDEECPRDERTISSRALMKQLLNIPVNGRVSRLQARKAGNGKSIAPTFMEELCSYRLTKREYAVHANKQRSNSRKETNLKEDEVSNESDANDDPSDVEIRELEDIANSRRKEIAHIEMLKKEAALLREQMLKQEKSRQESHEAKKHAKLKERNNNDNKENDDDSNYSDEIKEHGQFKEKRKTEKKEKNKKKSKDKGKKSKKREGDVNKWSTLYETTDTDGTTQPKRWLVTAELDQSTSYNVADQLQGSRKIFSNECADESSDAYSDQLEQTITLASLPAPASALGAHWMPPSADALAVQKADKRRNSSSLNNSNNTSFEFGVESLQSTPLNNSKNTKNVLGVVDRKDADDLLKYDPLFVPHKSIRELALEDSSSSSDTNSDNENDNINSNNNQKKRRGSSIDISNDTNGVEYSGNDSKDKLNGHHHHHHHHHHREHSDDMNEFVRRQIESNKANLAQHKEHNEYNPNHVERRASGSITSGLSLSFDRPQLNKSELRDVWRPSETKSSNMMNSNSSSSGGCFNSPFAHSKVNQSKSMTSNNRTKVGLNAAGYSASANTPSFTTSASRLFAAEPAVPLSTLPLPAPQTGSILVHHDHLTHTKSTSNNNISSSSSSLSPSSVTAGSQCRSSTSSSQQFESQGYKESNFAASSSFHKDDDNDNDSGATSRLSHAVSERPAHFESYKESSYRGNSNNHHNDTTNNNFANSNTMSSSSSSNTTGMAMMTAGSPEHSHSHSFTTSSSYSAQPARRVGVGFNFNKTKDNTVSCNVSNASHDHSTSEMSNSRKSRSVTIIGE